MRKPKIRKGLTNIGGLFEKYQKTLIAPQKAVIDTFCDVVEDVCGFPVNTKDVTYTPASKTIGLNLSGPIKTEILMHHEEILIHLKGRLGEKNTPRVIL